MLFYHSISFFKERRRITTQLDTRAYYTLVEKARLNDDLYEEDFRGAHDKNFAALHATPPLHQRLLSRLRQLLRGKPQILALPAAAYLFVDRILAWSSETGRGYLPYCIWFDARYELAYSAH